MSPPIIRGTISEVAERRFNEWVGAKLQGHREKLKLSRAFVAGQIGIDETTLMRNESGETPLTCTRAAVLCTLYNMDMRELFT